MCIRVHENKKQAAKTTSSLSAETLSKHACLLPLFGHPSASMYISRRHTLFKKNHINYAHNLSSGAFVSSFFSKQSFCSFAAQTCFKQPYKAALMPQHTSHRRMKISIYTACACLKKASMCKQALIYSFRIPRHCILACLSAHAHLRSCMLCLSSSLHAWRANFGPLFSILVVAGDARCHNNFLSFLSCLLSAWLLSSHTPLPPPLF